MPERIQLSRARGWKMPANTVKVGRTTKWGNPFVVGRHGGQDRCVKHFTMLMAGAICLSDGPKPAVQQTYLEMAKASIQELHGKNLACWCRADQKCHAAADS